MTRGKNSRHFRAIGKDFRCEKKKNHVEKPRDCDSHRDEQQSCAKFDRVRRSSANVMWSLKFPLLRVQVLANDVYRRDKRARMIITSQAGKSEKFTPLGHGVCRCYHRRQYSRAATYAYFHRAANFGAPQSFDSNQESNLSAT